MKSKTAEGDKKLSQHDDDLFLKSGVGVGVGDIL